MAPFSALDTDFRQHKLHEAPWLCLPQRGTLHLMKKAAKPKDLSPKNRLLPLGRMTQLRKRAGFTLEAAAAEIGLDNSTLSRIERNQVEVTVDRLYDLAQLYRVTTKDFFAPAMIPIVGYVGAGGEIITIDDHAHGTGLEEIELPAGLPENTMATIVRGTSGQPFYKDGDLLLWSRAIQPVPDDALREDCVIRLDDGRTLLKQLLRGSAPGKFTLLSYNAEPIEDVTVEWAAPVLLVDRRRRGKAG